MIVDRTTVAELDPLVYIALHTLGYSVTVTKSDSAPSGNAAMAMPKAAPLRRIVVVSTTMWLVRTRTIESEAKSSCSGRSES